jgi:hypothetical protein
MLSEDEVGQMSSDHGNAGRTESAAKPAVEAVTNSAEGGFTSENKDVQKQARKARDPEGNKADLLEKSEPELAGVK